MNLLDNLDALLISNQTNIRYLTRFVGASPTEREAYILILRDAMYLFTNALYIEGARKIVQIVKFKNGSKKIEVVEISRDKPLSLWLKELLNKPNFTLGFEDVDLTVAEFDKLKNELTNVQFIPSRDRVEELRAVKNPDEIENICQAAKTTDECFSYIQSKIKTGVTESFLAWEIEKFFKEKNTQPAFDPIVAFNQNSSMPHYSPSASYKLKANSLILLDFAARVNGYCADMTRVIFFGKATDEQKKIYEILRNAQQKAIIALENGERNGAALDTLVRNQLEKDGLPTYPHSLGHGVGLAIHELPRLSNKQDVILKPGMVITIEPGVYLKGRFGMRIEDLVLIKNTGIELLSKSTKEMMFI
jgi:Xaa-Pro aminopeptidase